MPALHGCDSRAIFCTARSCTELHGPTCCTELHRPASHCGCTALHGRAAAWAPPSIIQPTAPPSYREIYFTATITTDLADLEVHSPACTCTAMHGLEDKLCCTELHGMSGVNDCTELHGTHAAELQVSRGCMSLHGSFLMTSAPCAVVVSASTDNHCAGGGCHVDKHCPGYNCHFFTKF